MLMKWKNPKTPDGWMPGEITLEGKTEKERPLAEACTTAAMRTHTHAHTHPKWSVTGLHLSTSDCSFHLYTCSTTWTVGLWKTIQISLKNKQQSCFFFFFYAFKHLKKLSNWKMRQLKIYFQSAGTSNNKLKHLQRGKSHRDETFVEKSPKRLRNCAN